jgi:hypothetical protein
MKQHKVSLGDQHHVYVVSWVDKKPVNLMSTYVSDVEDVIRHEKDKKGKYVVTPLKRPTLIGDYNRGMGGTDLFDQYMAYYRSCVKTKKWTHGVFFHLFNLCVVNSWIVYKTIHGLTKHQKFGNLKSYIEQIVENLLGEPTEHVVGESSLNMNGWTSSKDNVAKPSWCKTEVPFTDPRYDNLSHWPTNLLDERNPTEFKRGKCRNPDCNSRTQIYCSKCRVALCVGNSSGVPCFAKYHTFGESAK